MENESKEIAVIQPGTLESVEKVKSQMDAVNELYKSIMQKDLHFGVIPGTKKDTLLKPGAEKIMLMFQLVARIEKEEIINLEGGHRECRHIIGIYHKGADILWGQGTGVCSTMESKFRYRNDYEVVGGVPQKYWNDRNAPEFKDLVAKKNDDGKWEFCKSKGKKENPDLADVFNTVQKMSYKRALVAAVISATGISDIFNQDIGDNVEGQHNGNQEKKKVHTPDTIDKVDIPDKINNAFPGSTAWTKATLETIFQDLDNCSSFDDMNKIALPEILTDEERQSINKKKMDTAKRLKGGQ